MPAWRCRSPITAMSCRPAASCCRAGPVICFATHAFAMPISAASRSSEQRGGSVHDRDDVTSRQPSAPVGLAAHEAAVARDLQLLNLPPRNWLAPGLGPDRKPLIDVIVVGAGMCGIAASAALIFK